GAMQRGFQNIPEQNKTVYYNQDGWMLYGQQKLNGHWYNFDTYDGAMKRGFVNIPTQNKTVYYNEKGQMQYGWQWIDNATRYFDTFDGKMAIGQQKLNGHWYLFDQKGAMQRGFQNIPEQNKTVYYNQDGWMLYGVQQIEQAKYYFDPITGALKTDGAGYDRQTGTLSYYAKDGKKTVGNIILDGKTYDFTTGILRVLGQQFITLKGQTYLLNHTQVITGQQKLNGTWYYFDLATGVMARGFQYLADQNKTVYYNEQGQMQYGQQKIAGHWYLFDTFNGAMKTGLQYISEQNKTVYYANNGQMQYGTVRAGKITYYTDLVTGSIIGVLNDAEVIGQNPELPTGCEITAVTMMLRYAGKDVNKIQLAHEMPRSNNGDYGFVGDPFSVTGWWVFPTGVAPVVDHHLGTSKVMTGASWSEIYQQLLKGHLVVAWVAHMNGFINHAVTLTGYHNGLVYYNNPWTAHKEQLTLGQFYTHWNADRQRALSY
ncbi:C39 family peptidase, partial [Ligilactobacillus faecis]